MSKCGCASGVLLAGLAMWTGNAVGQEFPSKPIRIVTIEAGGNADFHARLIAQGLSAAVGQPVIVDNRGGTAVAASAASNARPDGYTLFTIGMSFWIGALLQATPYDPVKDFAPVTLASNSPSVLAVNPSVAAKSVKELIALAKAKPGELNYAAGPAGSSQHLAGELFKAMAQVNIVAVPYKSAAPGLTDVMGGQVQLIFGSASTIPPYIKSGKLTALAVTSAQPSALFPNLPTVAASVPGYASGSTIGVFAPAGIPAAMASLLNAEIVRVLNKPEVKEKLFTLGIEVVASSPEQFAIAMKSEMARLGKVIKEAGIRIN